MKTLRFKVGDLARVVNSARGQAVGLIARIEEVAPGVSPMGFHFDYLVSVSGYKKSKLDRGWWRAPDEWLAPLPGDSHIHADTLKLFDQKPNTDLPVGPKVKERV